MFSSQGLVDTSKEIEKLEKRFGSLTSQQTRLQESMQKPDYESKVPETVRNSNKEKVSHTNVWFEIYIKNSNINILHLFD